MFLIYGLDGMLVTVALSLYFKVRLRHRIDRVVILGVDDLFTTCLLRSGTLGKSRSVVSGRTSTVIPLKASSRSSVSVRHYAPNTSTVIHTRPYIKIARLRKSVDPGARRTVHTVPRNSTNEARYTTTTGPYRHVRHGTWHQQPSNSSPPLVPVLEWLPPRPAVVRAAWTTMESPSRCRSVG